MSRLNDSELPFSLLQFYSTSPYTCSYLPDETARSQVANVQAQLTEAEANARRLSSLVQQQLVAPVFECLFDLLTVGGHVSDICFRVPGYAVEITEFTVGDTNIGGVHVPVDLPGHLSMGHLLFPQFIADEHQVSKRCVMVEVYAFFYGQKSKIKGFFI